MDANALTLDSPLGDWAETGPAAARILDAFHLDYCCGGTRSLAAACTARQLDPVTVRTALTAVAAAPLPDGPVVDWRAAPLPALVEHIVATHHAFARQSLDRLLPLAGKVARVHGDEHPELAEVRETFRKLAAELLPHFDVEEQVVFPAILQAARSGDRPNLDMPLRHLETEHAAAGQALERLRELTSGYALPDHACRSYRALFEGLAALERDTHAHVHAENHILFARVRALKSG